MENSRVVTPELERLRGIVEGLKAEVNNKTICYPLKDEKRRWLSSQQGSKPSVSHIKWEARSISSRRTFGRL